MVILLYALGLLAMAAALYGVAALVFGRGDDTPALPSESTPTVLPVDDVTGADVRALQFQQVVRGYKPHEVDWALERLAREVDALRARLAADDAAAGPTERPGHGVDPTADTAERTRVEIDDRTATDATD